LDVLRQDPNAFEFEFAWKRKVRQVKERRALLESGEVPATVTPAFLSAAQAAVEGTLSLPVVAALYPDVTALHNQHQMRDRLFGSGSGAVSVTALYKEMSGDLFTATGAVSPWLTLPQVRSYYEPAVRSGDRRGKIWQFLRDALTLADADIDFALYDSDGPDGVPNSGDDDGYVDLVPFLYATVAMSCGGETGPYTGIWPHRSTYRLARFLYGDGVYEDFATGDASANGGSIWVHDYIIQSAVQCDGVSLMGSGTMSHELGHALDLPDLYDVDPNDGTDSEGIGEWGLMASGNWNLQTSPAQLSAWSKDQLGWLTVTTVQTDLQSLTIDPVQSSRAVVRVALPESEEYLLLSDRQPLGSDQHLNGSGLLIWHIDPAKAGLLSEVGNRVNADANHKGVDLEEADGLSQLDFGLNRGDSGDPYPGSRGNTEFTSQTNPTSEPYSPALCTAGVRSISESSGQIYLDISVSERYAFWGDTDGSGVLTTNDAYETYWYALGYRDPVEQVFIVNGDVDGDGDVDIRDAFIVSSYLDGVIAPEARIGSAELVDCTPGSSPPSLVTGAPRGGRTAERIRYR
jgi:M6 family metalloprotease-like protein